MSTAKTQPIRALRPRRNWLRRITLLLVLAMLALGLLVMGFALGRGLEPAPAARALLSTVIAALPDSFSSAPPFAIPTRWTEPTDTAIPPVATSAPTDTAIPPTATPEPTDTAIPPTATDLPPTDTAIPPTATDLPTDTAIPPTATDLPPSATPIPQASGRACYSEARLGSREK